MASTVHAAPIAFSVAVSTSAISVESPITTAIAPGPLIAGRASGKMVILRGVPRGDMPT